MRAYFGLTVVLKVCFRHADEKRVAVVKSGADYTVINCLCNVVRQGRSNLMKCPDVKVACFADCRDVVVERQVRVEDDAEILNRRRQRYARISNVDI